MTYTYQQLYLYLCQMPKKNRESMDVTFMIDGEYYPAHGVSECDDGVLDDGHPFLFHNELHEEED